VQDEEKVLQEQTKATITYQLNTHGEGGAPIYLARTRAPVRLNSCRKHACISAYYMAT
jgi:hypothetical protein